MPTPYVIKNNLSDASGLSGHVLQPGFKRIGHQNDKKRIAIKEVVPIVETAGL